MTKRIVALILLVGVGAVGWVLANRHKPTPLPAFPVVERPPYDPTRLAKTIAFYEGRVKSDPISAIDSAALAGLYVQRCRETGDDLYGKLVGAGVEVLYDERDESPGAKFATIDLIGLPDQLVIGPRGLAAGTIEMKNRRSGERRDVSIETALNQLIASDPVPRVAGRARQKVPKAARPASAGGGRSPRGGKGSGSERRISDPA